MLTDPAAMEGMMGGMKNQVVMMIPQMVIMGWINFFFQGFVLSRSLTHTLWMEKNASPTLTFLFPFSLVKLPFPLTFGFKSMLQRGIDTPDMDVRWVSSLSWYFLNWFGLNGLYRVILGSDNGAYSQMGVFFSPFFCTFSHTSGTAANDKRDLATSPFAPVGGTSTGQPQDYHKLFTAEAESLQLAEGIYKWVGDGIEERILRKYGKL